MAVSHFFLQFQLSARDETRHVTATKFQPGGRAEISTRAEIRHVIGPLGSIISRCLGNEPASAPPLSQTGTKTGLERAVKIEPNLW